MSDKLDNMLELTTKLNERLDEMEKRNVSEGEVKAETEKLRKQVTDLVESEQKERTALAAQLQEQKEGFDELQKQILANGAGGEAKDAFKEYEQHVARFMKKSTPIPLDEIERICLDIASKSMIGSDDGEVKHQAKALSNGSAADGGFFLTTDRSSTLSRRMFETSPIRPLANVQTTTSDMFEIILDDDQPASGWVGEVTARPVTDNAQVGMVKIPIHELYAKPRATQKILDDAGFDVAAWHQGKVARKFARDENAAFTVGDGASKPKGFLAYSAWASPGVYQRDAVEQITSGSSGVIEGDDIITLAGSLIEDYHPNAQWAMSRQTFFEDILTLKGTDGHYLINPRLIAEGGNMVLLGKPVNFFNDMADVAANALSVAIADWSEFYTIVDRIGIRVIRDPYTDKPYVLFYTTKRVGGAVTNFEAGKILKIQA